MHNWLSAIYLVFEGRITSPSDLDQLFEVNHFPAISDLQNQQTVDWNKDAVIDFEIDHVLAPDKYQILYSIVEKSWENIHNRVIIIKVKVGVHA